MTPNGGIMPDKWRVTTHDESTDTTAQKDFSSWSKAIGFMTSEIIRHGENNSHTFKFTVSIELQ